MWEIWCCLSLTIQERYNSVGDLGLFVADFFESLGVGDLVLLVADFLR